MRALLVIALLLQLAAASGQSGQQQITSLDEALKLARANNPIALSDSGKKKLTFEIKSSWFLLLYQIQKWKTMQVCDQYFHDLERVANLQYESGEIDYEQKSHFIMQFAEIRMRQAVSANDVEMTANLLRQLVFSDLVISPADSSLNSYQIDKGPYANQQEIFSEAIGDENSLIKQYAAFSRQKTIENMQLELDGLFMQLQFFLNVEIPYADILINTSLARLKSEEYNYLEFAEKISEAFKTKLKYLETLNKYNQNAILLEYVAY